MAQTRTFQFYGVAYGSTPVTVTASVGNTQVFSGEVPTANVQVNLEPSPGDQTILLSVNSAALNTDFAGNVPMSITVTGGTGVVFGEILSDYCPGNVIQDPFAGTQNEYLLCYGGNPPNSENTPDTRSSVKIDGVTQVPPLTPSLGTWNWYVPTGSTISYNWNIGIGQVGNVQGNVTNYTGPFTPTAPVYPPA